MNEFEQRAIDRALSLPIWTAPENATLLGGGITNFNIRLEDQGRAFVVRVGEDIPVHQILRANELAAHRAAEAVGLAPEIIHAAPGVLVIAFITGKTLSEPDIRDDAMLARIVPVLKTCHGPAMAALRGPILSFWVFHVLRDYAATLRAGQSRHMPRLAGLLDNAASLEDAVGPIDLVLGHNDLLAANFLDDGARLWLLDWEYGGLNSPLFDLAGLASNNALAPDQERWLLEAYFEAPAHDALYHRYHAMKCASLLRETMWSMVSEIHSDIDFDYADYTEKNLARFTAALTDFQNM